MIFFVIKSILSDKGIATPGFFFFFWPFHTVKKNKKKKKKNPHAFFLLWNQSILKEISPEYSLEGLMLKLKLQYFGQLILPDVKN